MENVPYEGGSKTPFWEGCHSCEVFHPPLFSTPPMPSSDTLAFANKPSCPTPYTPPQELHPPKAGFIKGVGDLSKLSLQREKGGWGRVSRCRKIPRGIHQRRSPARARTLVKKFERKSSEGVIAAFLTPLTVRIRKPGTPTGSRRPFMASNSCSIRASRRRSSPPLTKNQCSRLSLPKMIRPSLQRRVSVMQIPNRDEEKMRCSRTASPSYSRS